MKNKVFSLKFDKKLGGIGFLSINNDPNLMNFCKKGGVFGRLNDNGDRMLQCRTFDEIERLRPLPFEVKKVIIERTSATVISESRGVFACTEYKLNRGKVIVKTKLTNNNNYPVYYKDGDISIDMPFNDAYESSDLCMRERCHTHIWAGQNVCYVRTERMGVSDNNVGIFFTKGKVSSYSQWNVRTHNRGYFTLNIAPFVLNSGESYDIEYYFFAFKNKAEFFDLIKKEDNYIQIETKDGFTVDLAKSISFSALSKKAVKDAVVSVNGSEISFKKIAKGVEVNYQPKNCGIHNFEININGITTKAVFNVISSVDELIRKRIEFIVDHQQCLDPKSPLYGAYLIYDNEEKRQFTNTAWPDYNGVRERLGMAISIVKWLQNNKNDKVRKSLDLYIEFLLRESVDEENGWVYGNIGKEEKHLRLYNPPWVMLLFAEYYQLTKDLRWAKLVATVLKYYYSKGGSKFYPNGIRFFTLFECLKDAGLKEELKEILPWFDKHIETIVSNGTNYPPHEVNFEQTIVTPAVTLLLDKYQISKDEFFLREAEKHLEILKKFDGCQPDCRQNKIPIRFWDDFWFGKYPTFGDTLHYWSTLSGYCFYLYGQLINSEFYQNYGKQCLKNCCYLLGEDGTGSCAYVYPKTVNGNKGEFLDVFANDQDFTMYFLMKVFN